MYFLGMLAYHLGRSDDAIKPLVAAANTKDSSLTANQIESALETLGENARKISQYGASAQMYEDIDKIFGPKMGEADKLIRQKRHLAVLLLHVPPQTVQFAGDFTLRRTGDEYPVAIAGKEFSAQLDTGATVSLLSASTAKAWGVTMLDGSGRLYGFGGGEFSAQPAVIPVLNIGKAELHNVVVFVTSDENLYIAPIKHQINALLGFPVASALGRLTFAKDGSLTASAQSPPRDPSTDARLWIGGSSVLVELGTLPIITGGRLTGASGQRLFDLDTGSASTYLTDHYLAEHTNIFHGPPPETARLAGPGGIHEIPAYAAKDLPLFIGNTLILLNGPNILTQPQGGETEHFFGLIGQDTLHLFSSYTIDLRNMTFSVHP